MKEIVSIIIPAFQAEKNIARCVDSVIHQKYQNLDILIINDGSSDATQSICETLAQKDSRIHVINKKNEGVSVARNVGLQMAKGRYILFVDSDDEVDEDYVECMISITEKYGSDLCICGYNHVIDNIKENPIISGNKEIVQNINGNVLKDLFCKTLLNPVWNKLYRKELITSKFDTNYIAGEDLLFNIDYLRNSKTLCIIDKPLYVYHYNRVDGIKSLYKRIHFNSFVNLYKTVWTFFAQEMMLQDLTDVDLKFINELSGCFLSSLVSNQLGAVLTIEEYRRMCSDYFVRQIINDLKKQKRFSIQLLLLDKRLCLIILMIQYIKYLRNVLLLKRERYLNEEFSK